MKKATIYTTTQKQDWRRGMDLLIEVDGKPILETDNFDCNKFFRKLLHRGFFPFNRGNVRKATINFSIYPDPDYEHSLLRFVAHKKDDGFYGSLYFVDLLHGKPVLYEIVKEQKLQLGYLHDTVNAFLVKSFIIKSL